MSSSKGNSQYSFMLHVIYVVSFVFATHLVSPFAHLQHKVLVNRMRGCSNWCIVA